MDRIFYSNAVEVTCKLYDVQLKFGLTNAQNEVIDNEVVAMSPQHAKILSMILNQVVDQYEQQYGTINEDPNAKISMKKQEDK